MKIILVVISIFICSILLLLRIPGLALLGISPNWLLIWLVTWSVQRNLWQSLIAAIALGLIQDSLSGVYPSHVFGLVVIALLTANVCKDHYLKENIITIMLIVFGMALITEAITALQYSVLTQSNLVNVWLNYQKIALASAIMSSLGTPLVYFPINYLLTNRT
jgi:rod shape-determining protein MreD